jgi:molybdenum-dependent DNA-binding transcriptional regulator ModE
MAATGKRFKAEQIVNLLGEIDVITANSKSLLEACQQVGINYKSYYRWCKIYGGLR